MGVSLDLAGFNGGLYVIYPTHMVNIMGLYKGFKWVELKPRDFIGKSWDCSMIALWQSLECSSKVKCANCCAARCP